MPRSPLPSSVRRLPAAAPLPGRAKRSDTAQIVRGLRRVVKAIQNFSQEVHREYGLTGPQLWALKTLRAQGRVPVGQLAEALVVHQSSLSVLIDRLEARGLVRRLRGTRDRRVVEVELTKRGAMLVADAPDPAQGRLLHGLEAMSLVEVRRIRQSVDRLVEAMEATDLNVQFFFSDE